MICSTQSLARISRIDKRSALAHHALFDHLETAEREQLLALGIEQRCKNGMIIFKRGEPGNHLMLVLEGYVKISIASKTGKELTFILIPPGECFGEIALLDGQPRTANAIAVGECLLFTLARHDFIPFLEQRPEIAVRLLALLCGRLRATNEFIERLAFENLSTRLACLLVKLATSHGRTTSMGVRITQKLSQQEIGSLIAASRESVNKQLQLWRTEGLLTFEQGYITLLQPTTLSRLANAA
jgi:CRP-like cAMP-binding protein